MVDKNQTGLKKILQKTKHDCFSACLATLLDMPLEKIPTFGLVEIGCWKTFHSEIRAWLKTIGWTLWDFDLQEWTRWANEIDPDQYCIGVHRKTKNNTHAVVLKGNKIYHNPDKGKTINEPELIAFYIIAPLQPFNHSGDK